MTYKEIVDLIKLVQKTDLAEVKVKEGEFKLSIRSKDFNASNTEYPNNVSFQPMPQPQQVAPIAIPKAAEKVEEAKDSSPKSTGTENLIEVKSPIVGTFYRSSSPDKPAYIKVGDTIEVGSVVCIVEAMKLFNEIESEVSGKVVKVVVEDASPVEYDQVLFLVEPS